MLALPAPSGQRRGPWVSGLGHSPGGTAQPGAPVLWTKLHGEQVGRDDAGNIYYQAKKNPASRWVIYDGSNDGSRVPPDWQAWLKGTIDELPDKALPPRRKFEQPAEANLTGTMAAFRPDGSLSSKRSQARIDRRLPALDARLSVRTSALMAAVGGARSRGGLRAAAGGAAVESGRKAPVRITAQVPRSA